MPILQQSSAFPVKKFILLARSYSQLPDPIVIFGATGEGVFLTNIAVESREVDDRLFDPAKEIFSGVAKAVGAEFFRTMIAFDSPDAGVLAEPRTLPAGEPVQTPSAGTNASAKQK